MIAILSLTLLAQAGIIATVSLAFGVALLATTAVERRKRARAPPTRVDHVALLDELRTQGGNDGLCVRGDLIVRSDLAMPKGLVLEGSLHVEDGVRVDAPLVVHGDAILGAGASLAQPIVVRGSATLGRDARTGPMHADGDVTIHEGAGVDGPLRCHTLHLLDEAGLA